MNKCGNECPAVLLHCLHPGHELGERNDFLVDAKYPGPDVGVVIVRDVIDGEYWSVLL